MTRDRQATFAIDLLREALARGPIDLNRPLAEMSVGELRAGLQEALSTFQHGMATGDGGRAGMLAALGQVHAFLLSVLPARDLHSIEPIVELMGALGDVDDGVPAPAFQVAVSHRKGAPRRHTHFKAACVVASNLLQLRGLADGTRLSRAESDRYVRQRARRAARELGVPMSERSIATWRRVARKRGAQGERLGRAIDSIRGITPLARAQGQSVEQLVAELIDIRRSGI
ncbi:MAG: hypothetical protein F9K29_09030 [Hyphomicrobiaceae bacterium]|nr:MAG: hypothetical protein F9K29_09030 [Hyphomicrobiaceae bacterium]